MSWEKDDAWSKNKKPGARRPRGRTRTGKQTPQGDTASEDSSTWATSKRKAEKRHKRRRLGWIAGAVLLVLLVVVALLPTIGGMIAPGIIAGAGSDAITGRVEVDRVHLSWFGSQHIEGIKLYDTDDTRRSDLSISASKGLLGLAFAGGDYGTVTIAGSLDASNNEKSEPFTTHTVGPAKPAASPAPKAPSAPPSLPAGLRVTLKLDDLQIQYANPARTKAGAPVEAIRLDDLSGTVAVDAEAESVADLKGAVTRKTAGAALFEKAGSVSIDAKATNLTDTSGLITTGRATIDATVKAESIESAIAELFADLQGRAPRALGDTVSLTLTAAGGLDDLATTIDLTSDAATLNAPLTINLGARTIAASSPITAGLDTERLSYLVPDREALLNGGADGTGTQVTAYPTIALTIDQLALPIPDKAAPEPDLSSAMLSLRAEIGRLAARVPTPTAAGGGTQDVTIEPSTISLNTGSAPEPATLTAALPTTIDGVPAGSLTIDLSAYDWRESGSIGLKNIDGAIRADRLAIAPFQPIAAAAGIDLVELLGESTDLALEARPDAEDATTTRFSINADAPRARAAGVLTLSRGVLRNTGEPLTLRLDRPDAALAPMLRDAGITITNASDLTVTLSDLAVHIEQVAEGRLADTAFRAVARVARLDAVVNTPLSGQPGAAPRTIALQGLTIDTSSTSLANGVRLNTANTFALNGETAGSLTVDLTVADLLDDAGAFAGGVPSDIRGTIDAENLRTAVLDALVPGEQLDLPTDLGPLLNATVALEPSPEGDRTAVALTIKSDHLNGAGQMTVSRDGLKGGPNALTLELTPVRELIARLANPINGPADSPTGTQPIRSTSPGRLILSLSNLDLPFDPAKLEDAGAATVSITADGLALAGPAGSAGTVRSFETRLTLAPGADPALSIAGELNAREDGTLHKGVVEGAFTFGNAFKPVADDGSVLIAPNGSLTASNISVTFARLLGLTFPAGDQADRSTTLYQALADAVGPTASLALTVNREGPAAPIRVAIDTDAGPHTLDASLVLSPDAKSVFVISDLSADANATLNEPTVRTAMTIAAPDAPSRLAVTRPGSVNLKIRNERGTLRAATTIAPTTLAGLQLGSPSASNSPNTPPTQLPPVTLEGLMNASVPIAMLADPAGTHAITFNTDLTGTEPARPNTPVLAIVASADATIADGAPAGPVNTDVRIDSSQAGWLDALAGMDGLLTDAVGDRLRLRTQLTAEFDGAPANAQSSPMPRTARATTTIDAPRLRTSAPAVIVVENDTIRLADPFTGVWTFSPELFARFAPAQPGKAAQATLAKSTNLTITADRFVFPLGENNTRAADLKIGLTSPDLPLRFADGSTYTLTDLAASLASMPATAGRSGTAQSAKGRLLVSARTRETPDTDAISIDSTVTGLPAPGAPFEVANVTIDGVARIRQLPMPLVDALANANGQLVTLLGPTLDMEATLQGLPQKEGTINFRADTPQSQARYAATVSPLSADNARLALITNEATTATITHFEFDFAGKRVAMLPVFGGIRKIEKTHRPATVRIDRLVTPVDGDIEQISMKGTVDPGVVEYEFERGLAALLKAANQRTTSNAGERLQPFNISMERGTARFDSLRVPVGEFTLAAEGSFDLVRQYEDITLGIPAGAFAGEAIGNLPGAASGLLNEEILVPVRRRGPMGADNAWEPDFQSVLQQLFSPEKIIDKVIKGGLKDLLGGGGNSGGGGG